MRVTWIVVVVAACGGGGSATKTPTTPVHETPKPPSRDPALDDAIDAQLEVLKTAKGAIAQAEAHGRVAALYWERSCPDQQLGLCVEAATSTGAHCGPDGVTVLVARTRGDDAALAREHAKKAEALWQDGALIAGVDDPDARDAAAAIASAKLVLADTTLERAFALPPPNDADGWLVDVTQAGNAADETYLAILADESLTAHDPEVAVIASARIAQRQEQLGAAIGELGIPAGLGTDDMARAMFCEQIEKYAATLAAKADEAWKACADTAARLQVTDPFAELCLQKLAT